MKTDGCVENTQRRTTAQRTAENAITGPNGPVLLTLSDPFRIAGCLFCLRALMLVLEAAEPADKCTFGQLGGYHAEHLSYCSY